jgi:putative ABC transport system permease protein
VTALRILLARLLGLLGGGARRERELRAEIDAHLAEAAAEYVRQGMTPEEARYAALRQFGGVTQTVEAHRDQRRFTFFSTLRQDLQYAVRALIRAPGFAIVAILTLAIGILGNTTIFSGVNALLYTPLPTERPEQIAEILSSGGGGRVGRFVKHTYKRYTSFRDMNTSFAALAAIRDVTVPIGDSAPTASTANQIGVVRGEVSSGNYFDILGVHAKIGRAFTPDEDRTPNGHPVVVISDRLWRTHFIADPKALGRVLYLNGHPFTVIGIAPASFTGTVFANETDFWAPLMMQGQFGAAPNWWNETRPRHIVVFSVRKPGGREERGPGQEMGDLRLLGRLKPDVSAEVASTELTAIAAGLAQANKLSPPKIDVVAELQARHQGGLEEVRGISTLALWASGLVWLIACGNVANLFLARATARRREIAIRLSLGAERWRVVRQLLTESTALGLVAGALAVALTFWTAGLLGAAIPANVQLPITLDFRPDLRVLGWGLALSLATGLVFGLAPAWQAVRTDLVPSLKPGESGSSHGARRLTLRNALVVAQLSISVVVLVAGGLFVRSLANARDAFSPPFATDRLLSMRLDPGLLGYKAPRIDAFYRDVLRQLKDAPRIDSVSLVSSPPFGSHGTMGGFVTAEGSSPAPDSKPIEVGIFSAGPGFFHTLGISIAAGRDFDERDEMVSSPVAILSTAEADRLFGSARNATGKRVSVAADESSPSLQVVGVFGAGRESRGLERHALYRSFLQHQPGRAMTLVVKAASAGELDSIATAVTKSIQKIDPVMPIAEVRKGEDHADPQLGAVRLTAEVAMLLGLVALTLASLGLYGVISYAVSVRAREIGIRLALGAHSSNVRALIIRQGMLLTALGLAAGLTVSLMATPVLQSMLINLPATDPVTFAGVSALLIAIALVACYVPASRATRIDPIATLRAE